MNRNHNNYETRTGFTLIELLLVMAIISVLATLALVVVGDAQYSARRNATQARINQISSMLSQRMENYEVRRIALDDLTSYVNPNNDSFRRNARDLQRRIITDIINVEMPRSLLNVAFPTGTPGAPTGATYPSGRFIQWVESNSDIDGGVVDDLAVQTPAFATRFIQGNNINDPVIPMLYPEGTSATSLSTTGPDNTTKSEYLYLILETTEINGLQATAALGERAFADTDGDGFLEVVDFWGNPIFFEFEMYDDPSFQDAPVTPNSPVLNLPPVSRVLNPGLVLLDSENRPRPAIPIRNIRVKLESTGNDEEVISN